MKNKTLIYIMLALIVLPVIALAASSLNFGGGFKILGQSFGIVQNAMKDPRIRFGVFFILFWAFSFNLIRALIQRIPHFETSANPLSMALAGIATVGAAAPAAKYQNRLDTIVMFILVGVIAIYVIKFFQKLNTGLMHVQSAVRLERGQKKERKWLNWFRKEQSQEAKVDRELAQEDKELISEEEKIRRIEHEEENNIDKAKNKTEYARVLLSRTKTLAFELMSERDPVRAKKLDNKVISLNQDINNELGDIARLVLLEHKQSLDENIQIKEEYRQIQIELEQINQETHDIEVRIHELNANKDKDPLTSSQIQLQIDELEQKRAYQKKIIELNNRLVKLVTEHLKEEDEAFKQNQTIWGLLKYIQRASADMRTNFRDYHARVDQYLIQLDLLLNNLKQMIQKRENVSAEEIRINEEKLRLEGKKEDVSDKVKKLAKNTQIMIKHELKSEKHDSLNDVLRAA